MARVTVEDCITKIPNRFELVLIAGQRARNLHSGAEETIDRDNDKNPVVALREIAEETIDIAALKEEMIFGLQKYVDVDEPEDENMAILAAAEKEWAEVVAETDDSSAADAAAADAAAISAEGKDDVLIADGDGVKTMGKSEPVATPAEDTSSD